MAGQEVDIKKIERRMKMRGLSQNRLAAMTGLSQGYISYLLRGKVERPSFQAVVAIARALGVEPDGLAKKGGKE